MKVCYLINQLAPGGAPTLLLDIVRSSADDVSFTVCQIEGDTSLAAAFSSAGADVVDFGARFKYDPRALSRMFSYFQRNEFDVLHAHLPYAQTLARTICRLGTVDAVVSTQHSFPENYHPISRFLEKHTRWFDDATVGISRAITASFRESPSRTDWYTVYNGTNVRELSRRVENADPDPLYETHRLEDETVVLSVGRYIPAKSQADVVRAVAADDRFRDTHAFIVGWGPLESELKSLAERLGVADRVTVTGRVPKDEIHRYYALADVFVLPSITEGFGICLIEAMAASVPVVATDIPGVREVVADGECGLLVPSNSPAELADALVELRSAERRRSMGDAGFRRVTDRFGIERTVDSHLRLYRNLESDTHEPVNKGYL